MTVTYNGRTYRLPINGRLGCNIRKTLDAILAHPEGIALYAAMDLRGVAKSWTPKYKQAFTRFASANADQLEPGPWGPKGGFGYRFKESKQ